MWVELDRDWVHTLGLEEWRREMGGGGVEVGEGGGGALLECRQPLHHFCPFLLILSQVENTVFFPFPFQDLPLWF